MAAPTPGPITDPTIRAAFIAGWLGARMDRDRAITSALLVLGGAVLYSLALHSVGRYALTTSALVFHVVALAFAASEYALLLWMHGLSADHVERVVNGTQVDVIDVKLNRVEHALWGGLPVALALVAMALIEAGL